MHGRLIECAVEGKDDPVSQAIQGYCVAVRAGMVQFAPRSSDRVRRCETALVPLSWSPRGCVGVVPSPSEG